MLSQLQASYTRLEQSLQRLTDSIAAYNPSTTAADELVAADDALSEDLRTLHTHQHNVLRLARLKQIAEENDEKIKTHFRAVAQLRKDLTAIPSVENSVTARDIKVEDLLAYARYISPTTVPPTFRGRQGDGQGKKDTEAGKDAGMSNGITTPPTATASQDSATESTTNPPPSIKESSISLQAMTNPEKTWLNPTSTLEFEPWPSHILIGNGALGSIQKMIESGRDPASVLSKEEQAEVDRLRKEEEERERVEEEERARRRAALFDAGGSSGGGRGGRGREVEDDVFDPDA